MPKTRSARWGFGLICVVLLTLIARNLYQAHLRQELLDALRAGDTGRVSSLLQRGMDPNTPLRNVNQSPYFPAETVSPLFIAVEANSVPLVELLLARGAKPDSIAFNCATSNDYHAIAMALLNKGADPNARRSDLAWKTLSLAMPFTDAAKHADAPLMQAMLDKGADPNVQGIDSQTALIIVCNQGSRDLAQMLLKRGATPNYMSLDNEGRGRTALMEAVVIPDIGLVRLLLDYKADVNAHRPNESNALMLASSIGNVEIVKLLLAAGADVRIRIRVNSTRTGNPQVNTASKPQEYTALSLARQAKHLDIVRLLQQAGATE